MKLITHLGICMMLVLVFSSSGPKAAHAQGPAVTSTGSFDPTSPAHVTINQACHILVTVYATGYGNNTSSAQIGPSATNLDIGWGFSGDAQTTWKTFTVWNGSNGTTYWYSGGTDTAHQACGSSGSGTYITP